MTGSAIPAGPDGSAGRMPHFSSLPEVRAATKACGRGLKELLARYISLHLEKWSPQRKTLPGEPPRIAGGYALLLPVLRVFSWLLALLFAISFLWDFPGVAVEAFGRRLPLEGLLRIVSVSGMIGFCTNWLAITMIFNPRKRRPVFGQGLIPAQRQRVIFRLAKAISEELINEEIIKQQIERSGIIARYREMLLATTRGVLEDGGFRRELKALTADYVENVIGSEAVRRKIADFLVEKIESHAGQGLYGLALKVYRFINEEDFQQRIDRAVQEVPSSLDSALDGMDHLLDRLPEKIEASSQEIEEWTTRAVLGFVEGLDVFGILVTQMNRYDDERLEKLLRGATNEQLSYIKYLGGLLGCLGGFVIWQPVLSLGAFGAAGVALYAVDRALYRGGRAA